MTKSKLNKALLFNTELIAQLINLTVYTKNKSPLSSKKDNNTLVNFSQKASKFTTNGFYRFSNNAIKSFWNYNHVSFCQQAGFVPAKNMPTSLVISASNGYDFVPIQSLCIGN